MGYYVELLFEWIKHVYDMRVLTIFVDDFYGFS